MCLPVKAVGYEEGGKRECAPLPYASIVRNPSIKKEIVNITVIIGVKDLVGDTYLDGEGAYDSCRQEIMKMFKLLMRDRKSLPVRMKRMCKGNECNIGRMMEYLDAYAVEVDVWLMINSLRQDINHSKDLKGLKTFVQVGKGMVICYANWNEGCGLKVPSNFIKVKVDKSPEGLAVFTSYREAPGTFLREDVLCAPKSLHNLISKGYDRIFR